MYFFGAEATNARLPDANWARDVDGGILPDSAVALWVANVLGEQTDFAANWKAVGLAFLRQYIWANAVRMAQAVF
jgi:hypothetical protein